MQVSYDVDVVRQEMSPICWVASCAMVKGYGTGVDVGIDAFLGADPTTSSLNPANQWGQCTTKMEEWGFTVVAVQDVAPSGLMTGESLGGALQRSGPAVLLHHCDGFPYGNEYAPVPPDSGHAVVITGIDTDQNTAWFNNPWGDKDRPCPLDVLLQIVNRDQVEGKSLGFWPA